ncbi:MAG: flagellin [Lachnospiraceae bacterium]|nr:flagellin [Lachnospiraceae bacterium]
MKINNNISAVITNQQLLRTEEKLAASMERLSSGFKINHSKDDPSGMAISNKMKAQIDGLSQASQNASDGSSVLETADGALNEVHSMLQRMRELAVQAANDTNSQTDRESIQAEITNLKDEIDRISSTTEFNTKMLLDGSVGARCYADNVSRIQTSEEVKAGPYKFTVQKAATRGKIETTAAATYPLTASGFVDINGARAELKAGMTEDEVLGALRDAAEMGNATIEKSASGLTFYSAAYGDDASIQVAASSAELQTALGLPSVDYTNNTNPCHGKNAVINMVNNTADSQFGTTCTYTMEGNKVTFTDVGGFKMSMLLDAGYEKDAWIDPDDHTKGQYDGVINVEVTDIGPMDLQIGSNEGQQMRVIIPSTDTENLYIDDMDVTTISGASVAIDQADKAIAYISETRSSLGAYTNRLDYAIKSLDQTSENMESAISRLKDVDMALEMTEYTRYNVLSQAATSALSQANELPQMALQLIG